MTQSEEKQRELLDEAGQILVRMTEEIESVSPQEVDKAFDMLASIERDPASEPLRREAAQKLDQINRTRSLPSQIKT